jgi:hypothetical protein
MDDPVMLFEECERDRVREHARRCAILCEDAEVVAEKWISLRVADAITDSWGKPDTSRNGAVSICRGLSTPGHYGCAPRILGPYADEITRLLDSASVWPLMQHAQFLATGHVMVWRYLSWSADLQRPIIEIVAPHETDACAHPDDPRIPVMWRRLRVRDIPDRPGGVPVPTYTWDVWAIRDDDDMDEGTLPPAPFFGVFVAERGGVVGRDVTMEALGIPALVGDAYPCRDAAGVPFLPVVADRFRDLGDMWGWTFARGAFDATLNGFMLQSYVMRAALDATGDTYVLNNMTPAVAGEMSKVTNKDGVLRWAITPGTALFTSSDPGVNAFVSKMGDGGHLEKLAGFAEDYLRNISIDYGLTPSDASRVGANPMSGLAIQLTNATKREEQERQLPLRRKADIETITKILDIARANGATVATMDGFGILYDEIDASPDEEKAEREESEWMVAQGMMSPIDLYIEWHEGATREDAVRELARVASDKTAIDTAANLKARQYAPETRAEIRALLADIRSGAQAPEAARLLLTTVYDVPEDDAAAMVTAATPVPQVSA